MNGSARDCPSNDALARYARDAISLRGTPDEQHVASCRSCTRKLDALVATLATAAPDPALDATAAGPPASHVRATLPSGARIGRHVVTRVLGAGAMGVVYEARDPDLDRNVAIKLLRHDRTNGDEEMIARLRREARALAQLAHPNVVAVHDVGVHDGAAFIAMEHVHGQTLREWLDDQPRSWREIVRVFEQAARGLAAAHTAGLVHRDFKPDNVMRGNDGRVRVMDFGLARTESTTEIADRRPVGQLDEKMTATGAFIGTPAYMAPEQFDGAPADARSDQFSFMVALYEALARKRPFTAGSLAELAIAVAESRPAPLPANLPRALRDLVMSGLAKEPAARHRSLDDVVATLAALQQRSARSWMFGGATALVASALVFVTVTDRDEPSACEVGARRIERHWDAAARARIASQFAKTSASGSANAAEAARALDDYTQRWKQLSRETCEAQGSLAPELVEQRQLCLDGRLRGVEALVSVWLETGDPSVVAAAPSAVYGLPSIRECTSATVALSKRPLTPEQSATIDRLRSRLAAGRARLASGLGDAGIAELRDVARQAGELDVDSFAAEADLQLGEALLSLGLVLEARTAFEDARAHAERAGAPVATAEARVRELGALIAVGELDAATASAHAAEQALAAAGNPERLRMLFLRSRGYLLLLRGQQDKAAADIEEAHRLTLALFGADSVEAAESERTLGSLSIDRQDLDAAKAHYTAAIDLVTRLHGDKHPQIAFLNLYLCELEVRRSPTTARGYCDAARTFYEAGGPAFRALLARVMWKSAPLAGDKQVETIERARQTLLATAGGGSLEVARMSGSLATLHFSARRYAKAAEELEIQVAALERVFGPEHPRIAERRAALGRSYWLANNLAKARTEVERALAIRETTGADPSELVTSLIQVGNLRSIMGDASAMDAFERAVALASQGTDADPHGVRLGSALVFIADQLGAQNNHQAALDFYNRASAVKDLMTRIHAFGGRASAYATLGKRREAERDLATARRLARTSRSDRPFVEISACFAYMQLDRWKLALRTCQATKKLYAGNTPVLAILDAAIAESQLELGQIEVARTALEALARLDLAALGVPAAFRGELMFVVARARRAARDETGALAAADEAETKLSALGLEGRRTLEQLKAWRAGTPTRR